MPETVFGLPTHAIVVHATVVLVPLASLVVLLHAFWPAARRRLGVVTPLLAGVALVLVPLSTESGEDLEHPVRESASSSGTPSSPTGCCRGSRTVRRRRGAVAARPAPRPAGPAPRPRWVPIVASCWRWSPSSARQQVIRVGHAGARDVGRRDLDGVQLRWR